MSKFNPERHCIETASALEVVTSAGHQERHAAYVGLDVHKDSIAVAVAEPGRSEPVYRGHRLPTLSGLSPTYPQAQQQTVLKED